MLDEEQQWHRVTGYTTLHVAEMFSPSNVIFTPSVAKTGYQARANNPGEKMGDGVCKTGRDLANQK